ncbi:MAG: helix-turn-helix domain-containing protein [Fusicatenibacter saccharivorans]
MSIAEICTACGFNHQSYYSKIFLRTYHCRPRDFRKRTEESRSFQNNRIFSVVLLIQASPTHCLLLFAMEEGTYLIRLKKRMIFARHFPDPCYNKIIKVLR